MFSILLTFNTLKILTFAFLCKYFFKIINRTQVITGIVTNKNQKIMIINGMPDHIHILVSIKPDWTISDLVRDIKSNSSKWINEKHWVNGIFEWQTGYGAFSVSSSQLMVVIKYIENQENHHKNQTFKNEYIDFLKGYQIDYNDKYLLEDFGVDDNNK
jgi:putative transposase